MNIRNQKKIIILLVVFTIIVVVFNKSYALFQTTAVSDKPVVQITTPDELPLPESAQMVYAKAEEKKACNPIIKEDGIIYLSGDNTCIDFNYVWYSGKLWRITAINPDGTMKMVTQDEITAIHWNKDKNYESSWIYQWLNEDFKDTLYNSENIIVQNASWNATLDEKSTPIKPPTDESATIVQGAVGSLNAYEYYQSYKNTSVSNGYLNIGYEWWLITPYFTSNIRRVRSTGNLYQGTLSESYGVRPSVNLKSDIELSGAGTKSNPYTIIGDIATGTEGESINTRISGEYVKVDEKVYRIVGIENGTTKLTSVDYVRDDSEAILKKNFGSNISWKTSVENDKNDKYWSYYLNNTWLTDNLKDYIIEGTYYWADVTSAYNYRSYKNSICSENNTSDTTKNCEKISNQWTGLVGLPREGEMFSAQLADKQNGATTSGIWLISPYTTSLVKGIFSTGYMSNNLPSSYTNAVRPSINLKSEVKIARGSGTESSPYEVKIGN